MRRASATERFACCVCSLLTGCGRVGVELLPIDADAPTVDGGDLPGVDGCTAPCLNAHGDASCVGGACVLTCVPGYADCDGVSDNGCEAALDSPEHCARCDVACPSSPGSAARCVAGRCQGSCDALSGVYGLKLTIPTTWPATLFTSPGSGTFELWGRVRLTQSGLALSGALAACGRVVPDFEPPPLFAERYGVTYPESLFERVLPETGFSGSLQTTEPGTAVSFAPAALVLGVALDDPIGAPWPSLAQIQATDDDGDGARGVMALYKGGGGYSYIPLDPLAGARAAQGDYALRVRFTLRGTLATCDTSSGSATSPEIDVRVVGCRLGSGEACNPIQVQYLDDHEPGYAEQPSTYVLRRLADADASISCASVRAALP